MAARLGNGPDDVAYGGNADVLERVRALVNAEPEIGRPAVAARLGITLHAAQMALRELGHRGRPGVRRARSSALIVTIESSYDQEDGVHEAVASTEGGPDRGFGRAEHAIDAQAMALRDLADRWQCVPRVA